MYPRENLPPRSDNVATIVLIALHAAFALITLFWVAGLVVTADPHGGCKYHNIECGRGARVSEAAWIGVVGTAFLIILDIILATRLLAKRQRSFVVPLLSCIGQLIVLGAVFALGAVTA